MPPQADGGAASNRFHQLLQPIRDLAANWDVDIANELAEYLSEVDKITYTFDNGRHSVNFAEAALLIQNSASVYSRKVEYLYSLVYQTLELVGNKKTNKIASSVNDEGRDQDASVLDDTEEEFLALDDLQESENVDLIENKNERNDGNVPLITRTPAAFMPQLDRGSSGVELVSTRGDVVGKRDDFRMNTSTVHVSGALILDVSDLFVVDKNLQPVDDTRQSRLGLTGIYTASNTPAIVEQTVAIFPQLATDHAVAHNDNHVDDNDDDDDNGAIPLNHGDDMDDSSFSPPTPRSSLGSNRLSAVSNLNESKEEEGYVDPWALLDPHSASNVVQRPFKKGKPFRIPVIDGQPTKSKRKAGADTSSVDLAQFLTKLHSAEGHRRSLPKNAMRAPTFPEFDYLFFKEQNRRTALIAKQRNASRKVIREASSHWDAALAAFGPNDSILELDHDDNGIADGGDDNDDDDNRPTDSGWSAEPLQMDGDPFPTEGIHGMDDVSPAGFEDEASSVTGHTATYEDLCRLKIDAYLATAQKYEEQLETSLSKRVKEWEERLRPLLNEQEHRPYFDVHRYGESVISAFEDRNLQPGSSLSLKEVVSDPSCQYEVIRLFMATLHLANNGNVDIQRNGDEMQLVLRNSALHDLAA